eukprot:scaffold1650_cov163-Amphora_coffeaeformis.AAC.2
MKRSSWVLASYCLALYSRATSTFAWTSSRKPKATALTALHMSSSTQPQQQQHQPRLALPEPLRSNTPGTWAYDTMSRRVDGEILERTVADNTDFLAQHKEIADRVKALRQDLRRAAPLTYPVKPSNDASAERQAEYEAWCAILKPHVEAQETWLTAPWMVAEFYVYRRLMDCFGYWDKGTPGYMYDPFDKQKDAGLVSSTQSAEAILKRIPTLPATSEGEQVAFSMALWGNKMDLSLWPADARGENKDVFSEVLAAAHENLLHDDSSALSAYCETLRAKGGGTVDIIVDNAGFELVTDLALAQYLVQAGVAKKVRYQLKSHPTFVSDALAKDLEATAAYYAKLDATEFPAAQAAGKLWQSYLENGTWQCTEHSFWVQGAPMWKMPSTLYGNLKQTSDLSVVKGDANYRRLLGDLDWDYAAPFDDVVGAYFPCPVVALRTLKAEIGCGMEAAETKRAHALDANWLVNGRFGVVHFSKDSSSSSSK